VKSCVVLKADARTADGVGETIAMVRMQTVDESTWLVQNMSGNIPQGLERPIWVSYEDDPATKIQKQMKKGGAATPGLQFGASCGAGTLQGSLMLSNSLNGGLGGFEVSADAAGIVGACGAGVTTSAWQQAGSEWQQTGSDWQSGTTAWQQQGAASVGGSNLQQALLQLSALAVAGQTSTAQSSTATGSTPTHSNVFVHGLPVGTDEPTLKSLFEGLGNIVAVKAFTDKRFGFIKFSTVDEAQGAINVMNAQVYNGTPLIVTFAKNDMGQAGSSSADAWSAGASWNPSTIIGTDASWDATPANMVPSDNLYVTGLPPNYTKEQTKDLFSWYGNVVSACVLKTDGRTDDGMGESIAMVRMSTVEEASWLVQNLNGPIPEGLQRALSVRFEDDPVTKQQKQIRKGGSVAQGNRFAPYPVAGPPVGKGVGNLILPSGQTISVNGNADFTGALAQTSACGTDLGTPGGSGSKGMKTRLCTYFMDTGVCPSGDNCTFAHGAHEIRSFKTRMCKFVASGTCPQGDKCVFAHSPDEIKS